MLSQLFSEAATGSVLEKNLRKLHKKTPVLELLFNKVADLQPATFLKRDSKIGVFL